MQFFSRLTGAALLGALAADAFLVTPDLSDKALEATKNTNNVMSKQTVKLQCQDCNIALDGSGDNNPGLQYQPTGDRLRMGIQVDFAVEDNKVVMGNGPLFPPFQETGAVPFFSAKQLVCGKLSEGQTAHVGDLPISTSVELKPVVEVQGVDGDIKIHPISIEILGMADKPVHVPSMEVRVAELPNGKLILLPIETTPYEHNPDADQCETIFCRVRVILATKIAAFKERIQRLRGGADGPKTDAEPKRPLRLHGGVNKYKGQHLKGKHHRCGRFRSFVRRLVHNIILPVLFGIATGMLVGAAAMLVFSAARAVFVRVFGRKTSSCDHTESNAEEGLDSRGMPPKYDEVFVESEEDVVDEKKPFLG